MFFNISVGFHSTNWLGFPVCKKATIHSHSERILKALSAHVRASNMIGRPMGQSRSCQLFIRTRAIDYSSICAQLA